MANEKPEKPGGKKISKAQAEKMTKAYKSKNKGKTEKVGYSAEFVRGIVNNPNVDTIWLAFAENDQGEDTIIISAKDSSGLTLDDNDMGQLCPPYCSSEDSE